MPRLFVAALAALLLWPAVAAAESSPIVHQETLQAGPYAVTVGFSDWPLRAERSVDITFAPRGGIADKTATLTLTPPQGEPWETNLGRHPRQRELWGVDLIAVPDPGPWQIGLVVAGPQGQGSGVLDGVVVEPRPGPPAAPLWLVGVLPLFFLIWLIAKAWRTSSSTRRDVAPSAA